MSCFSCQSNSVQERDAVDDLRDILQGVQDLYPDAAYPSIISREGVLIATLLDEERLGIDLTATISAIHSAAKHFSSILGLTGCPHLQISGDTQVFSLYGLHAGHILVFFNNKVNMSSDLILGDNLTKEDMKQIVMDLNDVIKAALEESTGPG